MECFKEKAGTARKTIGLLQQEAISSVKDIPKDPYIHDDYVDALLHVPPGGSAD